MPKNSPYCANKQPMLLKIFPKLELELADENYLENRRCT